MDVLSSSRRRHPWGAVLSVAVGTFVIVTTEFLPIGLLSGMAGAFQVTPGEASALVTVPGLVAALAAPACMIFAGRADRRDLLVIFTLMVVVSNIVVALAPNLATALIGRAVLGVSVGGFWTFAAAVGRRLVPPEDGNRATTLVMSGISIGTVVGVPMGTTLGHLLDWRLAFLTVAGLALLVLTAQLMTLPRLRHDQAPYTPSSLWRAVIDHRLRPVLLSAALIAGGQFTAYTFLEPLLAGDEGADPATLGWLLSAYGMAGVVGTFAGERLVARSPSTGFFGVAVLLETAILALPATLSQPPLTLATIMLWGAAFGAIPVCIQIWLHTAAPEVFEVSSAMVVTVFQLSLATGAALGGGVTDRLGLLATFHVGAFLVALSALASAAFALRPRRRGPPD